ncbi:MAG: mechanosensitive ion channel protein MscS [Bacteroidota bacterium]|nr:mechanosensitive ion channel protein MscS [Bacteroidota bacterium]
MLLSFIIDLHKIETLIAPVGIIAFAIVFARIGSMLVRGYIRRSSRILKADPTNYSFIQHAVSLVIFLSAVFFVFWSIPQLHDLGKTLFAGAGILAAAIGFASQEAFSNIISGIFIVIYKPFSVGDNIKLVSNGQAGVVEDITLRHTIIKSNENKRIIITNSVISREQIINSSIHDPRMELYFEVLISFDSDHNKALEIMKAEAENHPMSLDVRNDRQKLDNQDKVPVRIVAFENIGMRLRASIWAADDAHAYEMKCGLLKTVKEKFDAAGIKVATQMS